MTNEKESRIYENVRGKDIAFSNKIHIRGVVKNGMTVRQLIHELQLQKMDSKVVYYDAVGDVYPVTAVVQDGAKKVGIF